ncbi:translocation/assembly module TamB domain-containing protein [Rhizobiaceae bacterium n13]|uniref:Translocation/assembly module TamB domain-containing protein n=1 Tax=Ferirhizobium litorale TaxID=2927786 RepID=A0AAE3U4P0_9HYPH|nr:translocation/assembly module TamB domain-containing protein [Fererhizobium litorale]MDI7862505.1 translocation/assembly module TamB domain-containing protein [Fererhizobium litorale]MDI7923608.1 translocation/assembly module TamB domain-containing protein [Fererhizobium litorale]
MTILVRTLEWLLRLSAIAFVSLIVLVVGAVLVVGFTPFGARLAADRIASLISTPDRTIAINDPSGLLTGRLRLGVVTVADTKGVYAEARNVAVDWSPLSLLSLNFDARSISAGSIEVSRAPVVTERDGKTDRSAESSSLPVTINVARISAPDIRLGKALVGADFALSAEGSANLDSTGVAAALKINRQDQPQARANADFVFSPASNELTLKADLSEPPGGLLAHLLRMPGEPAVKLDLSGSGALSDWSGKLSAAVDGRPVLSVDGRHQMPAPGSHRLDVKGGGTFDTLLPEAFRPLFAGTTDIDVALTFDEDGRLDVEAGRVTTGSLALTASGGIDPRGNNNLKANLAGTGGEPVDFRWPLAAGEARLLIDKLDLSLTGPADAVALDLDAALRSAEVPQQGRFEDIRLTATSDRFNLTDRSGPVGVELSVENTVFDNPDIDRAIRGPLKLAAPLTVSPHDIAFDAATLESAHLGGTVSGRYDLAATTLTSDVRLFARPEALPADIAARFDTTIAAEGKVTAVIDGPMSVTGLTVKSGTIEASGDAALENDTLTANLSGRLPEIGKLIDNASGAADFTVSARGPLTALMIQARADAERTELVGRTLQSLAISIDGIADRAAPQASIKASGLLDNQTINIDAGVMSENGVTRIPNLSAVIGPNRLTGDLRFSQAFEPSGNLTFDFPDVGLLAALAGQRASGDLKGSLALTGSDGRIGAVVKASGSGIRRDDIVIARPDINLVITDLKALAAQGTVRLAELASGANKVTNLALDFTQAGQTTNFDLKATYDGAPLTAAGAATSGDGTTTLALRSFSARPRGIPVNLAGPATVTLSGDNLTVSTLGVGLELPGQPPMQVSLDGSGALSDWSGKLSAAVDGRPVLSVDGRHQMPAPGSHRLDVKGGGTFDTLLPEAFRPLFAGTTDIDVALTFDEDGRLDVEAGRVTTGSLALTASGGIDPRGNNNLKANLAGTGGEPVDFRWPLAAGEARLLIDKLDLSLTGPADAVALDLDAALRSAEVPQQGRFEDIRLTATSDRFNLTDRSGPVGVELSVENTVFDNPDIDRAIRGPLKLAAPLTVSPHDIAFDAATLESAHLGGTVSGRYDLAATTLTSDVRLFARPEALPADIAARFDTTIAAEGKVTAVIDGPMSVTGLTVKSGTIEASGDAALENDTLTANLSGRLPEIGKLIDNASGAADFTVSARGPLTALMIQARADAERTELVGRTLQSLAISIDGIADRAAPQASIKASGLLDNQTINIDAGVMSENGVTRIPNLSAVIGPNRLTGDLRFSQAFEPSGNLTFDFPDVGLLAALAGQRASGDLKGSLALTGSDGRIGAVVKASGSGIRRDDIVIARPDINLVITDLKALAAQGTVRLAELASGANKVTNLALDFTQAGQTTNFDLKATYDGAPLTAAGAATSGDGTTTLALRSFSARPRGIPVNLSNPTTITVQNGNAALSRLVIRAGAGSINIDGSAGSTLDITARISNLPASLANTFSPGLEASGEITGSLTARGRSSAPVVGFDITWSNAMTSQLRAARVAAVNVKAKGQLENNVLRIDVNLTGSGGLAFSGGGTVALGGNRALKMNFRGGVPFAILAGQLSPQGLVMEGSANVNLQVGGTTAAPAITGSITADRARLIDVRRNVALNDLALTVNLERERATISRFDARLSSGGTLTGRGTVGIVPGSGFPADLTLTLNRANYVDGTLFTARVDGTVTVRGPLLRGPVIGGSIVLDKASITVPEKLPTSLTEIDIKHRNAPAAVIAQLREILADTSGGGASTPVALDLTISAPSRIFVRGRGIDAELGGDLTVRGTAVDPIVSGGFEMRRGRMVILNRRLDFTKGIITFGGALIPRLDMDAATSVSSTTITVSVNGLANDPQITFSSSPALPQDEILAQLIFGQSLSRLSPLQIAQLADAASQLAGGRQTSLFQGLRSHLGIDDLDISTDASGRTQVSAGKYLNDRTYLELQQGGESGSKAIINLDVGRGVKLRGEAGADGSGAAGIFYEKEY